MIRFHLFLSIRSLKKSIIRNLLLMSFYHFFVLIWIFFLILLEIKIKIINSNTLTPRWLFRELGSLLLRSISSPIFLLFVGVYLQVAANCRCIPWTDPEWVIAGLTLQVYMETVCVCTPLSMAKALATQWPVVTHTKDVYFNPNR